MQNKYNELIIRHLNNINYQINKGIYKNNVHTKHHIDIKNTFDKNIRTIINMLQQDFISNK